MKIIHTGDWHLGHRLYNYDRSDEERHFFLQLADLVEREQPDALLVGGDVFHTGAPGNDVAKVFTDRLLEVTARCPGMETVVIAGNHDSYSRLVVDEALWKRCHVHVFGLPAEDEKGRAVFGGNVVVLPNKGIVAAVPFCHERNFPSVDGAAEADRMGAYFAGLRKFVEGMNDSNLPTILMAHLAVGKETDFTGQQRSGVIGGEECVDVGLLGSGYDYIALGHIHRPQWIRGGRKVARYCGTPRAIHFDEAYEHGADVVAVEAGREPVVRTEVFKPLYSLKTFGGNDGVPFEDALKALNDADMELGTYIRMNIRLGIGELPGPDWTERARRACAAKGVRFCVNNPIKTESAETGAQSQKVLTMTELRELSNDKILDVLSSRHEFSERHRELLRALIEEVMA